MQRRAFLQVTAAQAVLTALPATLHAQDEDAAPEDGEPQGIFSFDTVIAQAKARASAEYVAPNSTLTGSFADLNYDQYRAIRFRRDRDPWADLPNFGIDLLSPGLIFYEPVKINLVREGRATPIPFSTDLLEFDPSQFSPEQAANTEVGDMGWSGFRMRTPLNRPDVMDEFIVFQGASYFRAVARGTLYGLSARGLAIDTGSPQGEEFPLFTDFWLDTPQSASQTVRIYAILDSKSVSGAFQFDVTPGEETVIETRLVLFPRADLDGAGIAPLTSMFWFSPANRRGVDDYRPAVHDSDGLQIYTGASQSLWRSLSAPPRLQFSDFVDENPKGFGLVQRERDFDAYQDSEARYERRPTAWIEPRGDWGKGQVRLVEIPVENEFNDNIVSYWRPREPLEAGQRYDYAYDLTFTAASPDPAPVARVVATRSGRPVNDKNGRSYVIDFELEPFKDETPEANIRASTGEIANIYVLPLPDENILRLGFLYTPDGDQAADLQASLRRGEQTVSESWVARWSR
ncbi:glucan biosynthesis protein [Paracoccaceae bacterium GXU_MW_L88]